MYPVLERTFGGLSRKYYTRQFLFGLVIFAFLARALIMHPSHVPFWIVCLLIANTLLYPYARFGWECVVGFLFGRTVLAVPLLVLLVVKACTMALCWGYALFIAPVSLIYLYFRPGRPDTVW